MLARILAEISRTIVVARQQWEPWGDGRIRFAKHGQRCSDCGIQATKNPAADIAPVVYQVALPNGPVRIVCFVHLLNPLRGV